MSDRDHGFHRRYETDPPRYDHYNQQSPPDIQYKQREAYLMTISPRSQGTGSTTIDDDDSPSVRHSLEVHPQYRGFKALYYHPVIQVFFLGVVCFMGPGLFNALNGLGGGGMLDSTTSANANSALYATFAVAAFFAGSINNVLGSRLTLQIGTTGYALYIGSYLAYNLHRKIGAFVIAAGAYLGISAGLLWTAQGSLMLAYPTEDQKGKFIGIFWSIFNLGGVVGAAVSFGNNFDNTTDSVSNGTYIGFIVLTGIGVLIPLLMANPAKMIRSDGTRVVTPRHPSWKSELFGLYLTLRTDPWIVLLFPMFFASNWFYTWQFNDYNGAIFTIRARALNNLIYWLSQIVGSVSIGFLLDQRGLSRRLRAFAGWSILIVMVFIVHTWAYFYQKGYTRDHIPHKIDIHEGEYVSRLWLYIFCGLLDSMWQTTAYWFMGAMSNDPAKLANFSGFYKSLQSAGAAGIWRGDAVKLPYMNIFISTWVLLVAGLIFALPMIHMRVKDTTEEADETLAYINYERDEEKRHGDNSPRIQ
ncbi:MFS general substrate transporter [Dichomitus squalens]|uniref:MFS general substrate transporter n=2 Tax=Dichomitus squalens TaxID=114155 RepID=A0A4Q9NXQ6_9APHY|nr:MFS general substrate transporter [Dichomitus squalens LYAD-421 SS1]EJF58842.1 MFS general substrate transporter [Dichomitus squalens LYAD-421 SS1]TBU46288.1 MFS general substrate transporter [Dichomitus squalens]TBU56197.1 MFS general substrate transporter [Dichomitus squalens]